MDETDETRPRCLLMHLRPVTCGLGVMLGSVSFVPAMGGDWVSSWLLGCALVGYGVARWLIGRGVTQA